MPILNDLLASLIRLICGVRGRTRGDLSFSGRQIFFSNHSSHLDFLLIWAVLPAKLRAQTRPVAGADYWLRGRVRTAIAQKLFRAVLIDRTSGDPRQAIEQMVAAVRAGDNLIVFPEGTRSLDGEVHQFKSGLYYLAKECPDVEFVPVFLENLNRILPKGEVLAVPLLGSVTFGQPLARVGDEPKREFLARARDAIVSLQGA